MMWLPHELEEFERTEPELYKQFSNPLLIPQDRKTTERLLEIAREFYDKIGAYVTEYRALYKQAYIKDTDKYSNTLASKMNDEIQEKINFVQKVINDFIGYSAPALQDQAVVTTENLEDYYDDKMIEFVGKHYPHNVHIYQKIKEDRLAARERKKQQQEQEQA